MRTRDDKTESEDIAEARSRIVNGALIFISIIAVPALAASFYRLETIGWQPVLALHASAATGDLGDYSVPQPGALSKLAPGSSCFSPSLSVSAGFRHSR
jgi:hypothetical protein